MAKNENSTGPCQSFEIGQIVRCNECVKKQKTSSCLVRIKEKNFQKKGRFLLKILPLKINNPVSWEDCNSTKRYLKRVSIGELLEL